MDTTLQFPTRLFAQPVRYEIPPFQRRYVWKQEKRGIYGRSTKPTGGLGTSAGDCNGDRGSTCTSTTGSRSATRRK